MFVKYFVNLFVDVALVFSDISFNSFSTSTCYVQVHKVTFLFNGFSLSSKSIFFTKVAASVLPARFACDNLAAKFTAVNLWNSGVVIYVFFFTFYFFIFHFINFCVYLVFYL